MSDKADYTGSIRAKGLSGTGVTEAMLGKHHRSKGGRLMVVASIHVAGVSENVDEGTGSVAYVIDDLEVAPKGAEEHIRELTRSFNYERRLEQEGPHLDDGDDLTPSIEDAVKGGQNHVPHPFLPVDAADDDSICDVCGVVDDANPAHAAYEPDGNEISAEQTEEEPVPATT